MFMQSVTDRATPWNGRRFGLERVRLFNLNLLNLKSDSCSLTRRDSDRIGETPTAHATDTLQGCHPSATSLEAGRAVLQVPQHEGGVPERGAAGGNFRSSTRSGASCSFKRHAVLPTSHKKEDEPTRSCRLGTWRLGARIGCCCRYRRLARLWRATRVVLALVSTMHTNSHRQRPPVLQRPACPALHWHCWQTVAVLMISQPEPGAAAQSNSAITMWQSSCTCACINE